MLELGFYPFVIGDMIKLYLAAALLPTAWRLVGARRDSSER
jgi:biotin transport system substrate-specific component